MKKYRILGYVVILLMYGCAREEGEMVEVDPPVVSTPVSEDALKRFELEQALMVLRGTRLGRAEVLQAYEILKANETPKVQAPPVALPNNFSPQKESNRVVERFPEAKLIITLEAGKVVDVKQMASWEL